MASSRSPRHWRAFAFFVLADLVILAFTWHSHVTYVGGPGRPTIMPVGQLIGWSMVVMITLGLLLAAVASRRTRNLPSYRQVRLHPPAD